MENKNTFITEEIFISCNYLPEGKDTFEVYLETGTEFKKALHRRFFKTSDALVYTEKLRLFVLDNIFSYLESLDLKVIDSKISKINRIRSIPRIELMKEYRHRVGVFNSMLSNVAGFYDSYLFYESKIFATELGIEE